MASTSTADASKADESRAIPDRSSVLLVQGDILTSPAPAARSIAVPARLQRWPDGIIAYTFDAALSATSRRSIDRAIEHWNEVGGISLLPLAEVERRFGKTVQDSVNFVVGDYCASWVGRQGGQQDLWIAPNCPTGSIMHEIGHLLGLEHEHTRPDRDQHIKILWENIEPDKRHNFDSAPVNSSLPGSYDVDSIMHYGSHNFSSTGKPTITLLDGSMDGIGQRRAPSEGDLQAVAKLYGSDLSVVARTAAVGSGAELDIYVTNQTIQGAHDVTLHVDIGSSGALAMPSNDQWICVNGTSGSMTCTAHLLAGGAVEHLAIELPDSQLLSEIDVQLRSKTPDSDLSNNSSIVASDDVKEPPERQPAPEPVADVRQSAVAQEDAVAHVSLGGGALDMSALLGVFLLLASRLRGLLISRPRVLVVR